MIMELGPRSGRIYRDLRARIQDGRLPVGSLLPSQSALAQEYGVAVMTARQALERLATEGFLRIQVGSGTYVESDRPAGLDSPSGLKSIVAVAPLPIITVDPEGIVTSWNPAAERMFGWSAEEVVGRPPPMVPPERDEERTSLLREVMEDQQLQDTEVVRQRRDGARLTLSVSTAQIYDAEGNITGVVFSYLDLTERKRVEEALRESQERFQSAFDHAAIGMAI